MYSLFNFFLIPPLPPSPHKPFSMQLGTITTLFYLLVTDKFPFAPFTASSVRVWEALGQKGGNGILKVVMVSLLYFIS